MGHSAGAHLVSIVATDPELLAGVGLVPDAVSCVVALDSAAYDLADSPADESGLVDNAFGTDPEVVAAASPLVQVRRQGAPVAPFLVVTRGSEARRSSAQEFADAVVSAGGEAELVDVNPYDHAQVNTELGVEGETLVTPPTADFLGDCLSP
jgi:acetyl esterase/lipase